MSDLNRLLKLAGQEAFAQSPAPQREMKEAAPASNKKMVCKDCGDEMGHPTSDCENSVYDKDGDHWIEIDVDGDGDADIKVAADMAEADLSPEDREKAMKRAFAQDEPERGTDKKKVSLKKAPWEESVNEAEADQDAVRELVLYAENDGDLYRQSTAPIQKNLSKKFTKGTYDHSKAVVLWKYHADRAAKKYGVEHGNGDGFSIFSPATRKAAAIEFADQWQEELDAGNLHEGDVNEAGGHYTKEVYDMIEEHGVEKVMHELLTAMDADVLEDVINRMHDSLNEAPNEGNEFSGALANAKKDGKEEFEVDGKKYKVESEEVVAETCGSCGCDLNHPEAGCDCDSHTESVNEAPTMDTTQMVIMMKNAGLSEEVIADKLNEWANSPAGASELEPTDHGEAYEMAQNVNLSLKRYLDAQDMKVQVSEHTVENMKSLYESKKNK